jgi:hypothetical protein
MERGEVGKRGRRLVAEVVWERGERRHQRGEMDRGVTTERRPEARQRVGGEALSGSGAV